MADLIRVDQGEIEIAYLAINDLQQEVIALKERFVTVNNNLQGGYQGQSAQAFDAFVEGTIVPTFDTVADMCDQTSTGLKRTLDEFQGADATLAGTFTG